MSQHLTDKSLLLAEGSSGVRLLASRAFATDQTPAQWPPGATVRVEQLELDIALDPREPGFSATARLTLRLHSSTEGRARLDLGAVEVAGVTGADGQDLAWSHHEEGLHLRGLPVGQSVQVSVRYSGAPPRALYRTGPTAAEPDRPWMMWTQCQDVDGHHLFPCIDHPSHKQPVRVSATVPTGMEVVGNGALVSVVELDGGMSQWTWSEPRPIPAYLFTLVVGPMVVVEDATAGGAGPGGADVPVRYLAPAGTDPGLLLPNLGKTPAMIHFLAQRLGQPYPYPRYDQVVVHDFIFGGMENAGATTLTDLALLPETARLDGDMDDLVVHELAHQWFGDLVTCEDWSQAWLNEGWATYIQYVWAVEDKGEDDALADLYTTLQNYMGEFSSRYQRALVEGRYRAPIDLFDRHLYEKGGLVLHTLRGALGEDAFWSGVSAYLGAHGDDCAHTRDFQRALEASSGRSLERFFSQWVHGVGHPALTLALSWSGGLLHLKATQTQSGDRIAAAFAFTLPIVVEHADGSTTSHSFSVTARHQALTLPCEERPVRVAMDAGLAVLLALKLEAPEDWVCASLARDEGLVGRVRAAETLARTRGARAVPALVDCLNGGDHWAVRGAAASALATIGGERAVQALASSLSTGCHRTRTAVITALGSSRAAAAREALGAYDAAADPSLRARGAWAAAVGAARVPGAIERLCPLLASSSWGDLLARKALEGLGACGDPDAWPLIAAAASPEQLPRRRAAAASAAGVLASARRELVPAAHRLLAELATEAGFRTRLAAVSALGQLGDPRARATLTALAQHDPDARLRSTAEAAVRRLDGLRGGQELDGIRTELKRLHDRNDALVDEIAKLQARAGGS
jgi:aminopeptidase N